MECNMELNERDCIDILSILKSELNKYVPNNTIYSKLYIERSKELISKIEMIKINLEKNKNKEEKNGK